MPADESGPKMITLALASRDGTVAVAVPYTGHSAILQPKAAKQALNLLRLHLLNDRGFDRRAVYATGYWRAR